jgi:hypothetical protein
VLWVGALLLVPLPYLMVVDGCVPVVRFALLALISGAYAAFVDGSGVVWVMTAILAAHALLYALALAAAAWLLVRVLPPRRRAALAWALLIAGFAVALTVPVYRTPFDDASAQARWTGLFQ